MPIAQIRRSDFRAADLIARKRDGLQLTAAELRWLIAGFVRGEVADYQMSAFAMAVVLRGMEPAETLALTLAMRDSGQRVRIAKRGRPRIDKHSTGGVGDKVSLCLAPLVAACGARVPMISGRGLGHTGGTLDKLEAIPGFSVSLPLQRFARQVDRIGIAFMGQTRDIAPADQKLYALRDVTATVESVPLITASILSKKLATDLDALVMDIKVGRGAFMQSLAAAETLAESIIRVGRAASLPVSVVFTAMDSPLGCAVGNALEAREAFEVLLGQGPADLVECTLALGAEMLRRAGLARSESSARRALNEALRSSRALSVMEAVVRAQGGDPRVVREPDRLPSAPVRVPVRAARSGWVRELAALEVGRACVALGAGRARAEDVIDPRVGLVIQCKPGERVREGELLAEVHAGDLAGGRRAARAIAAAYRIGGASDAAPLILGHRRARTTR
jgi:pyrimidine-nucleoside phosphorylase